MSKLSIGLEEAPFSHPAVYCHEDLGSGTGRLKGGLPGGDPLTFLELVRVLDPPYDVLFILHTPRGEAEPGRYLSPLLDATELFALLHQFSGFFQGDGRHHLWVRSPDQRATVVWDNHDIFFAYGPIAEYEIALRRLGFVEGPAPSLDFEHNHHFRAEFDGAANALMAALPWSWSELQDGDR